MVNLKAVFANHLKGISLKIARLFLLLSLLSWLFYTPTGLAQQGQQQGPVYIVQEGDTLWEIASRFRVSVEDLQLANNITNANQLAVGDQLVIPGLDGVEGVLTTRQLGYGENLLSLTRNYDIHVETLVRLNRLISPAELYSNSVLILPDASQTISNTQRTLLAPGQSLLELAALHRTNPWTIVNTNDLPATWGALPGDVLLTNSLQGSENGSAAPGALPSEIREVQLNPSRLQQGKAAVLTIASREELQLEGSFMDHDLHFFPDGNGQYIALQGVHALAEPGIYPLDLQITLEGEMPFEFSQMVRVAAVDYPYDEPLNVNPTTIDPAVTKPEDAQWAELTAPASPERYWSGIFSIPSPFSREYCLETGECWSSRYGNRRSYNGSPYNFFHTGLDIVGKTGTEIYAAAPGVVVFAGPLTVRGNATVIDHGWGVYTAYMHQSEILVTQGDRVEAGQLIGLIGDTGRVEGPHLHWEVWAGGVQVDPLDWLTEEFP